MFTKKWKKECHERVPLNPKKNNYGLEENSAVATQVKTEHYEHVAQFAPPPPLGDGVKGGGLSHFSECLYRRDLGQIGILGGNSLNFFLYLVARGWEYFKFLGDLLYWGVLISFLGEGGQAIFFHKAINDQSCKLKNS